MDSEMDYDFAIYTGEECFLCHKIVLTNNSRFFEAMFSHDTMENRENEIEITNISQSVMKTLIKGFYSSQLELNQENMYEVFEAAIYLFAEEATKLCESYIISNLSTLNYYKNLQLVKRYNHLENLMGWTRDFCIDQFEAIVHSDDFVKLDVDTLEQLLDQPNLGVPNEDVVVDAIFKWIGHDSSREPMFNDLLTHVRFYALEKAKCKFLVDCLFYETSLSPRRWYQFMTGDYTNNLDDPRFYRKSSDNEICSQKLWHCNYVNRINGICRHDESNSKKIKTNPST